MILQAILDIFIGTGHKDSSQDLCPLLRLRIQKLPELALGDHCDLLKLLLIYMEQLLDGLVHLL